MKDLARSGNQFCRTWTFRLANRQGPSGRKRKAQDGRPGKACETRSRVPEEPRIFQSDLQLTDYTILNKRNKRQNRNPLHDLLHTTGPCPFCTNLNLFIHSCSKPQRIRPRLTLSFFDDSHRLLLYVLGCVVRSGALLNGPKNTQ